MARLSLVRFHKLGGLYPGSFLKPYSAEVEYTVCINRMPVSQCIVTMVADK